MGSTHKYIWHKYIWNEWLCKTNFSFLFGASHPNELIARAAALGYRSLAISDFDGVYGIARCYQDRARIEPQLKLHYGAEIHFEDDHDLPVTLQNTLVLLARTHRGYQNLCRILSYAHRDRKTHAFLSVSELLNHATDDLVAIVPMRGLIRRREHGVLFRQCRQLQTAFPNHFYLVVSKHLHLSEDIWIKTTLDLGRALGAKFLLSQDAFFHEPMQADMSDLLHAIRCNKTIGESSEHLFPNGERCLHSQEEIASRFSDLPIYQEALRNSDELAASFDFDLDCLRYHYPQEMIPRGFTAQSFLEHLTWESASKRYGSPLPEKIMNTLQHELNLISHLNFADYFLTVWDIVSWARAQDILCQGRGSAANSAVCFVLGITSVDPAFFELLFERFISVERGDPPDIDVDFEHERREEVIQYIYQRYGRERAAMVANVITFRTKGARRAVAKALGIPESIIEHSRHADLPGDCIEQHTLEQWSTLTERLKGFPRHLGLHSGGFMLTDQSIDALVPLEPATMPGRTVIQWCKDDIEALKFFKVDILGLGMLTALKKCFTLTKSNYETPLTLASIPPEDPATYAMIQRADTVGVFQIESRAQMSMLPRLKPKTFYDLVIEVAIIRPGPIQGKMIHPFLRRREGLEPVTFPDPRLEKILKRTLGVPVFQEQVMRVAMAVGGFTAGEANELRKHIGSFSIKGDVETWVPRLMEGMRVNGIKQEFIDTIVGQIRGFASYGFPESHAASFALLAYASAYLKCHYPAAFFTALLNSQPMGFYDPHTLIQSAKHAGITILPVCVNHSDWESTLEQTFSKESQQASWAIRLGLHMVNCLSEQTAKDFVAKRREIGYWETLAKLLMNSKLSRVDLTALAAANSLQCFGLDRRSALWIAEAAPFSDYLKESEEPLAFAKETNKEALIQDFRAFSTSLNDHPARLVRHEHWCYEVPISNITLAKDILPRGANSPISVFGMLILRQSPPTAKGMLFATLEDETGLINLAIQPPIHEKYKDLIEGNSFFCVSGTLQKQGDASSILVKHFYAPQVRRAKVLPFTPPTKPASPVQIDLGPTSRSQHSPYPSRTYDIPSGTL